MNMLINTMYVPFLVIEKLLGINITFCTMTLVPPKKHKTHRIHIDIPQRARLTISKRKGISMTMCKSAKIQLAGR